MSDNCHDEKCNAGLVLCLVMEAVIDIDFDNGSHLNTCIEA